MNISIKYKIALSLFTAISAVFLYLSPVYAHPGNTASDGCHYCRTNCDKWGVPWNERHCHGGSSSAPPPGEKPIIPPPPTAVLKPKVIYPTWTPLPTRPPKPTSTPKPTKTPTPSKTPTLTTTPIPTHTETPSPTEIYSSPTTEPILTSPLSPTVTTGEVAGLLIQSQNQEHNILSEIFHFLTFGLFRKEKILISPIK